MWHVFLMNAIVTIPRLKNIAKEKGLVLISRREYEALRMKAKAIPRVSLTAGQKSAISRSERELRLGKYLTLRQLEHELGSTRAKARK